MFSQSAFLRYAALSALVVAALGCSSEASLAPAGGKVSLTGHTCSSYITGGGTSVSSAVDSNCTSCSASDAPLAIDGDISTFATLQMNLALIASGESAVTLRATAQSGVVYAAGNTAGAQVTFPTGVLSDAGVVIRTYLGGVMQEHDGPSLSTPGFRATGETYFYGLTASTSFDAVEISVVAKGSSDIGGVAPAAGTALVRVLEFCSS